MRVYAYTIKCALKYYKRYIKEKYKRTYRNPITKENYNRLIYNIERTINYIKDSELLCPKKEKKRKLKSSDNKIFPCCSVDFGYLNRFNIESINKKTIKLTIWLFDYEKNNIEKINKLFDKIILEEKERCGGSICFEAISTPEDFFKEIDKLNEVFNLTLVNVLKYNISEVVLKETCESLDGKTMKRVE